MPKDQRKQQGLKGMWKCSELAAKGEMFSEKSLRSTVWVERKYRAPTSSVSSQFDGLTGDSKEGFEVAGQILFLFLCFPVRAVTLPTQHAIFSRE